MTWMEESPHDDSKCPLASTFGTPERTQADLRREQTTVRAATKHARRSDAGKRKMGVPPGRGAHNIEKTVSPKIRI